MMHFFAGQFKKRDAQDAEDFIPSAFAVQEHILGLLLIRYI